MTDDTDIIVPKDKEDELLMDTEEALVASLRDMKLPEKPEETLQPSENTETSTPPILAANFKPKRQAQNKRSSHKPTPVPLMSLKIRRPRSKFSSSYIPKSKLYRSLEPNGVRVDVCFNCHQKHHKHYNGPYKMLFRSW
ncbi:unnamed protein product [Orchesella dallaii]|uniref:Uncharacterized protein n=1 Tax=Orchesella dallaii TaxID=48710 RepID=A0ABP1RJZ7_9HEXA